MNRSDVSPWAIRGLYLFALTLVLAPVIDLFSTAWPPRLMELTWRYGFLGLLAGYLSTPILGFVLAAAVAHWGRSRTVMKGLGVTMMAAASVLLLIMATFALDVLQMRELRPAEAQSAVVVAAVLQELKYATACVVLAALGVGASRTAAGYRSPSGHSPGIVSSADS